MNVEIPDETIKKLESRAKEKNFDDVQAYINHLLEQVASKIESQPQDSDADEEKVKKRLKDLGYL